MHSNDSLTVIQAIQLMLAPAVMINGCGLLLLSISNKFSSVVNRVRLLNEERRKLFARASDPNFGGPENQRLESKEGLPIHRLCRCREKDYPRLSQPGAAPHSHLCWNLKHLLYLIAVKRVK